MLKNGLTIWEQCIDVYTMDDFHRHLIEIAYKHRMKKLQEQKVCYHWAITDIRVYEIQRCPDCNTVLYCEEECGHKILVPVKT